MLRKLTSYTNCNHMPHMLFSYSGMSNSKYSKGETWIIVTRRNEKAEKITLNMKIWLNPLVFHILNRIQVIENYNYEFTKSLHINFFAVFFLFINNRLIILAFCTFFYTSCHKKSYWTCSIFEFSIHIALHIAYVNYKLLK